MHLDHVGDSRPGWHAGILADVLTPDHYVFESITREEAETRMLAVLDRYRAEQEAKASEEGGAS